jgi:hypothetical protein
MRAHHFPLCCAAARSAIASRSSLAARLSVQRRSMAATAAAAQVWCAGSDRFVMASSLFFFTREAHPKASEKLGSPR